MTGDRSQLRRFVKKFFKIVRFGNDHFGAITGYGDYLISDSVISMVYYVEILGHSLSSVRHAEVLSHLFVIQSLQEQIMFKASSFKPFELREDLGKLQPTANIRIFVGYAPSRKGYRIYNKRTRRIMEIIHVQFDEMSEPMAPIKLSTGPAPSFLTPGHISSWLVYNSIPTAHYVPPTNKELEILFQSIFDEYLAPPHVERPVSPATAAPVPVILAGTPCSTTIDQDAHSLSHSPSSSALQHPISHQGVAAGSTIIEDNPFAHADNDPFINVFALNPNSEALSSWDARSAESTHVTQPHNHLEKLSKDHSLDNVIGNLSRPILICIKLYL
nr:integrase, catalytic region, zinc finger, CCHC-type, peptidase aspartic, catalytic [Tanacetum cinerariifolium]